MREFLIKIETTSSKCPFQTRIRARFEDESEKIYLGCRHPNNESKECDLSVCPIAVEG
jgi:hypothetical protein